MSEAKRALRHAGGLAPDDAVMYAPKLEYIDLHSFQSGTMVALGDGMNMEAARFFAQEDAKRKQRQGYQRGVVQYDEA